jgi:phosphohistidine phosphatase
VAQQLWLLRHGEAVPHAPDDDGRALTERGREQARAAGLALAALDLRFQHLFTSPKVRAADTAALAAAALGMEPVVHQPLRQGFDAGEARALLGAAGEDQRVLLVGHNPDFVEVVHDLTGARIELKKGGVAGIRLDGARGELIALLRPRELDRLAASA